MTSSRRYGTSLGVPVMFTEFGADAFNSREMREDQEAQARYLNLAVARDI